MDALVVGAGPAGLAVSRELSSRKVEHIVLEKGEGVGHCWSHVYDSLRLHTGKHLSHLRGRPFPRSAPIFVPAPEFLRYLQDYAAQFDLPIRDRREALTASRESGGWCVRTEAGPLYARALVIATGVMSNPIVPSFAGRGNFAGTVRHSAEYRRPDPFVDRHVLVGGAGNSAGEIAPELATAGAEVTVAIRSGANVVPLTLFGLPIQYVAWAVLKLPAPARAAVVETFGLTTRAIRGPNPFPRARGNPLENVPLMGFKLVDAIRGGAIRLRGGLENFTRDGVRFEDGSKEPFDDVILATGYRAALGPVEPLVRRDERGFALRRDRVISVDQPDLYFVGHTYDGTGGLNNIARDARAVTRRVAGSAG